MRKWYILLSLLALFTLALIFPYTTHSATTTPIETVGVAAVIEPNVILKDGKLYIAYINVTHSTYAEGDAILAVYDIASSATRYIVIDDSDLVIDIHAAAGRDSILVVVSKFVTGRYRDVYAYLYNITADKVYGPFPIAETPYYDEYPLAAYHSASDFFAVAVYTSGGPITEFSLRVLKFSNNNITTNRSYGPFTTRGGNITYTTASHQLVPYLGGFIYLYPIVNETDTTNRDIEIRYLDASTGEMRSLQTIVTPGQNESLGDVLFIYHPSGTRSSAIYRPYGYITVGDVLLVPVYTYGPRNVKLLKISPNLSAEYIVVGDGKDPYICAGTQSFAVSYLSTDGRSALAKVFNSVTLAEIATINLSLLGSSAPQGAHFRPLLTFASGYYIAAWSAGNPSSIFAAAFDEGGTGIGRTNPIIRTDGSYNATLSSLRSTESSALVVYMSQWNATTPLKWAISVWSANLSEMGFTPTTSPITTPTTTPTETTPAPITETVTETKTVEVTSIYTTTKTIVEIETVTERTTRTITQKETVVETSTSVITSLVTTVLEVPSISTVTYVSTVTEYITTYTLGGLLAISLVGAAYLFLSKKR